MLDLNRVNASLLRVAANELRWKEACEERDRLIAERVALQAECKELEQCIELARRCLEESLQRKKYIEELISQALSEIYDDQYEFNLEVLVDEEGNIKGLKPRLKCGGGTWRDPQDRYGTGPMNVVNLCLHIVCLAFIGGTQKVLFMDEPLANISASMQARLENFLRTVCKGLGIQLVMITHQDAPFGRLYRVSKKNDISKVEEIL